MTDSFIIIFDDEDDEYEITFEEISDATCPCLKPSHVNLEAEREKYLNALQSIKNAYYLRDLDNQEEIKTLPWVMKEIALIATAKEEEE